MIKGQNPNSDPNIYISKTNTAPLKAEDADVVACEAKGLDICVIKYSDVVENSFVYIAVVAQFPARYSLRIDFERDLELEQNDFLSFKMTSEDQVQIIKFKLGQINYGSTEIEVIVQVLNEEELEEPFYVFMNKKENGIPSNTKFDYQGKDSWQDNKVIEFKQQQSYEEFIILVQAEQGAKIQISSQQSSDIKQLYPYSQVQQVVEKGEFDLYVVTIDNYQNKFDYSFSFIPFQGSAKMYVNLNYQPPLLDNYEWQEEDKQGYSIFITQKEIEERNVQVKEFYIAIYGEEYCTYQLGIQCYESNQDVYLSSGTLYSRNIYQQQIPSFELFQSSDTLVVQVMVFQGKINFLVTNCFEFQCPKTNDIFDNYQGLDNQFNFTLIEPQEQSFEFRLNCINFCTWRIFTQLDKSVNVDKGHFSIRYHQVEDQLQLQENTPHKSYVAILEEKYYKFYVSEDDKLFRLSFLLTTIEGKATIYVSTSNQKPNEEDHEFKSTNNSINLGGRFGNPPETGHYYITILGNSECKFTITVWAIRSFEDFRQYGKFPWHYIQLYQGDPQQHQIENDQVALFKIDLASYSYQYKRDVIVNLQSIFGQVEMLGFSYPEVNEENFQWKSNYQIQINENDENFPEILYLRVKIKNGYSLNAAFRISYHQKYDQVQLYENEQYFNYIETTTLANFMFSFKKGKTFVITKNSEWFDQDTIKYVIDSNFGVQLTFSHNNNSILVKSEEENEVPCQMYCQSYVFFSLKSNIDQFYSIIISKIDQNEILLKDGQPLTKVVPIIEDNFYFYAQTKDLSIITFSYSSRIFFYAKILQVNEHKAYPNKTYHDKSSKTHHIYSQTQIYFSQRDFEQYNCSEYCIVYLTVFSEDNQIPLQYLPDYTIEFNQNVTQLREEESQYGFVVPNQFVYYSLRIPSNQNQTNLMVLLNPVGYCDANLYISKNRFPSLNSFDWGSQQYLGDIIIIEAGNRVHPDMSGQYILGIAATSDCNFIIQYKLGNYKMFDIIFNVPTTMYIEEGEIVYFIQSIYDRTEKITIFFESPTQTATFFVDEIDELERGKIKTDLYQFRHNNNKQGYQDFLTIKKDFPEQNIFYLIAVKGYTNEKITIQTSNDNNYIMMEQSKIYSFYLQNEEKFAQISPNSDKIMLFVFPRQGLVDVQYCYKSYDFSETEEPQYNQLSVQSDWTKNQFILENKYNHYILLKLHSTTGESIFKIWYAQTGQIDQRFIFSIYPEFVPLSPSSQASLIYTSQNGNITDSFRNQQISVTLYSHSYYQTLITNHKVQRPDLFVYSRDTKSQLPTSYEALTPDIIYREYEDTQSEYEIIIINNDQSYQGYWLQVGTSDLRPLIPEFKQFSTTSLQQSNYFFYSLPSQSTYINRYLFYEIQFCDGLYQVFTSGDLDKLKEGVYDTQIEIMQNKLQYGFIEINNSILYLKLQMYKKMNEQSEQGEFTIKVYEVEQKEYIPYDKIYPGEQGYLTYQLEEMEDQDMINLVVNYAPLNYSKVEKEEEDFTVETIEYYLLVQGKEESYDATFNYCIEPYHQLRFIQSEENNYTSITTKASINFRQDQRIQTYVFTILAKAHVTLANDQKITLDYYYEPRYINWDNVKLINGQNVWHKFKVIFLVIISLMIVLALIIFLRSRGNKQRQQFEYNDSQQSLGVEMQYRDLQG